MLHIYLSQSLTSHQTIYQLKYIILCIISSLNHHAYICCTTTDATDHGPWFINLRLWLMTHGSCLMFMLQNRHQYKMKRFIAELAYEIWVVQLSLAWIGGAQGSWLHSLPHQSFDLAESWRCNPNLAGLIFSESQNGPWSQEPSWTYWPNDSNDYVLK